MNTDNEVVTLANGDIVLWVEEESSIHIKSVTQLGDPVEMNLEEVNELCEILRRLATRIS
jgi:hypothetical protein